MATANTFTPVQTSYLSLPTGEMVFYRHAGSSSSPTILLLHGFPTSSHQYRNLIPLLAHKYRVIAPGFPGFGFTTVPSTYEYTFAALTTTTSTFLQHLPNPPRTFAVYIFDYGAPVALRLALQNPAAITAIVTQNGNAYDDGLSPFWAPIRAYWASGAAADRDALRAMLTPATTRFQYDDGTTDPSRVAPESYTLDQALLDRPDNAEIQLDLFKDYENNVKLYPEFHRYFRESQVPLLAAWGKNDKLFAYQGALAYKRDLPKAEVHLLDAGHFAGETETAEIAGLMLAFLERNGI